MSSFSRIAAMSSTMENMVSQLNNKTEAAATKIMTERETNNVSSTDDTDDNLMNTIGLALQREGG